MILPYGLLKLKFTFINLLYPMKIENVIINSQIGWWCTREVYKIRGDRGYKVFFFENKNTRFNVNNEQVGDNYAPKNYLIGPHHI